MTESVYKIFFLWLPPKPSLLASALFDCIVEFGTYHPHYKDKFVSNSTQTFVYAANYLCFLNGWNNLSTTSLFACDSGACTTELGLVTKKRKPPKNFLYPLLDTFQPLSLIFSSTFSEICLAMLKCRSISVWQLSLTLASFSSLLTYKTSLNLSCTGQTIEFLPSNQYLLNMRLQWQITDKFCRLR